MTEETLQNQVDEMRALLASQLRVRGATLEAQVRKAGRRLPRRVRHDLQAVTAAMSLADNPKLSPMVDRTTVSQSVQNVIVHLKTIDRGEQFKGRVLGILGSLSVIIILTFVAGVYVLVKRGLI